VNPEEEQTKMKKNIANEDDEGYAKKKEFSATLI
jgi:hypothetical protein